MKHWLENFHRHIAILQHIIDVLQRTNDMLRHINDKLQRLIDMLHEPDANSHGAIEKRTQQY